MRQWKRKRFKKVPYKFLDADEYTLAFVPIAEYVRLDQKTLRALFNFWIEVVVAGFR